MNYENDITINPDELDVEWLRQSFLVGKYGKELADAEERTRRAEEKVKVIRSEIILEVNKNGIPGGGEKTTAQTIEAYYRTHEDYIDAKKDLSDALHNQQIIQVAVSSLHQKRAALENLVKLLTADYFSGPTNPRNLNLENEKRKRKEEASDKIMQKSRRKKEGGRTK